MCYSIGRPRGIGPRGNAASSAAISAALSARSPAAALSAVLARSAIAAPLTRVVGEIRHVENFALDQVD